MNKKTMQFNLDVDSMKIREILTNKDFLVLEFWALSDVYPNNNNSHFPLKSMELNLERKSFFNKPVLGKFNNLSNNYEVHNYKTKYDPEYNMEYCDYEDGERPLGLIRESDTVKIVKDKDGLNWVVFTAVIWVKYNYKGVKKLLTSKRSKVSVEVTINEWYEDDNGVEIYNDWTFDGVTILGYQKNSLKEAKEGIPSAHMTILEKMKKNTFSNQIKSLKFAYDELSNTDIDENNTHLYIDQETDKEAIQLTYEDKKDLLQQALNKTYESEVIIKDFTEDTVSFVINDSEKSALFTIDEESSEITLSMEDTVEESSLEGEAFEDENKIEEEAQDEEKVEETEENPEDKSEEMAEDTEEKNVEEAQDEEKDKEEESCGKGTCEGKEVFENENSEDSDEKKEVEEEVVEESCGKGTCEEEQTVFEEDKDSDDEKDDVDDKDDIDDKDDVDDSDEKKEEESSEENNKECGKFVIDNKEYTAEEVVEKYFADMEQANMNYNNLQNEFNTLTNDYNDLKSNFEACSEKLKKFETQELVNEVKKVLNKTDFTEEEKTSFIERCENKEFNSIQEATKEIAYIAFMNREDTNQNNETNFSAKADFSMKNKNQKETKKIVTNCFDELENYINK